MSSIPARNIRKWRGMPCRLPITRDIIMEEGEGGHSYRYSRISHLRTIFWRLRFGGRFRSEICEEKGVVACQPAAQPSDGRTEGVQSPLLLLRLLLPQMSCHLHHDDLSCFIPPLPHDAWRAIDEEKARRPTSINQYRLHCRLTV